MSQSISRIASHSMSLPLGWRQVRLDEVCQKRTGIRDPRTEPTKQFKYVDIASVDNVAKRIIEPKNLPGTDAPSRARQIIREGDVLVSTTRPNLNAVALVPPELNEEVCSTGFCVLRANDELSAEYLFAFVQSREFIQPLSDLVKGALYPAVTDSQVRAQLIPLPPLPEQKRIAAILKEQMPAVERARAAAEAQLKAAEALPAAYVRAVFGRPEVEQWQVKQLGELASSDKYSIKRGPFGGHLKKEIFVPEGYKVYEQGNAIKNDFTIGNYYITEQKYKELEAFKVQTGDVIISCSGTIGKVAIIPDDAEPGIINQALLKVSLNRESILPKFFKLVFESDHIKKQLKKLSYGSGLENVASVSQLKQVTFPTPSIETQEQIIELYEDRIRSTNLVLKSLLDQLDSIDKLPAALLRQAFAGKL